jgi:hypothetical protein
MNNPDTNIFKIDRENDIEKFSRYHEKGISSINNISKSNIPSRLGKDKVVAGNYKLSSMPKQFIKDSPKQFIKNSSKQFIKSPQKQFIKNPKQQFNKYPQRRPNGHNFPKLDNLIIDRPQYRRYFSYPYYYDYYYDPIHVNQNLDNLPVINSVNYYVPYEYIPAERYYKGEIRTKFAGEKDENDIVEAEEFPDIENNSGIENFKTHNKENTFPFFIVLCIVVVIIFIIQPKPK